MVVNNRYTLNAENHPNTTNYDQINYFINKEALYNKIALNEIKTEWENIDTNFRHSNLRKKCGYIIKGYTNRTVITRFGPITIKRTKYQYFDHCQLKKKTFYWLDSKIKILPYKRVILDLEMLILNEADSGKRQRDIVDQFKSANLTRATIGRIIRQPRTADLNHDAYYLNYKIPKNIETKKYIYLEIDDAFTSLRNNKKLSEYRIRLAVAHLGYINDKAKRKQLLHKRAIYFIQPKPNNANAIDSEQYASIIYKQLQTFYGDLTNKKIIVCGDGANWIKEIAFWLQADFVLDKYHLMSLIFSCFTHIWKKPKKFKSPIKQRNNDLNKTVYERCIKHLYSTNNETLFDYLFQIQSLNLFHHKQAKIMALQKYLKNNWNGIKNYQKEYYIGCRTEALVSHTVKSLKAYGAKIYGINTFTNMLNLRVAKINQLNSLDVYLTDINEETESKNQYYVENIWKQKSVSEDSNDYLKKRSKINIKSNEKELIDRIKYIINND